MSKNLNRPGLQEYPWPERLCNKTIHSGLSRHIQTWLSALQILSNFLCKPGPKSRSRFIAITARTIGRFALCFCCLILCLHITIESTRSEGCILVMEDAEALPHFSAHLGSQVDAKPHDMRPETCDTAKPWLPAIGRLSREVWNGHMPDLYNRDLMVSWTMLHSSWLSKSTTWLLQTTITEASSTIEASHFMQQTAHGQQKIPSAELECGGTWGFSCRWVESLDVEQCIEAAFITETRWCFETRGWMKTFISYTQEIQATKAWVFFASWPSTLPSQLLAVAFSGAWPAPTRASAT